MHFKTVHSIISQKIIFYSVIRTQKMEMVLEMFVHNRYCQNEENN